MMAFLARSKGAKVQPVTGGPAVKPLFSSSILKSTPSLKFIPPLPVVTATTPLQSTPIQTFTSLTSSNSVTAFHQLRRSLSTQAPPPLPPPLEKESSTETVTTVTSKVSPVLHPANKKEVEHGLAPDYSTAPHAAAAGGTGRLAAAEYLSDTEKFPPGSLGYLVRESILKVTPVVGDVWSGSICNHYKSIEKFLRELASAENIRLLATNETVYWRTHETGGAWVVGGATPACLREEFLLCTLAKLRESGKWNDQYEGPGKGN